MKEGRGKREREGGRDRERRRCVYDPRRSGEGSDTRGRGDEKKEEESVLIERN